MANIIHFFVLAFSRTEEREFRTVAAIEALSKEHAWSAAAHLADYGQGTVAFSIAGELSTAKWEDPEVIARFGDRPDGWAPRQELSRVWSTERSEGNGAFARPCANVRPVARSTRRRLSNAIPFAIRQNGSVLERSKRALAIAGLIKATGGVSFARLEVVQFLSGKVSCGKSVSPCMTNSRDLRIVSGVAPVARHA
jgi:hypothetical protein